MNRNWLLATYRDNSLRTDIFGVGGGVTIFKDD